MENKEPKEQQFQEWVTFIEDRVSTWESSASPSLNFSLDYSAESLKNLEGYLLANFNAEALGNVANHQVLDAITSYLAETFRRNLPETHWFLELGDLQSIDYDTPCLKPPIGTLINPFRLIRMAVKRQKGTFFFEHYQKRLGFIQHPETY